MSEKKIKAGYYSGERKQERCAISDRLFDQEPGLKYTLDGDPISPELAQQVGFEISDIRPPKKVKSKVGLMEFITNDLGIKRSDKKYLPYYGNWSKFYPTQEKY